MRRTPVNRARAAAVAATALVLAVPAVAQAASGPDVAPLVGASSAQAIDGRYVVVLKDGETADARALAARSRGLGGTVTRQFDSALTGFAAKLDDADLATLRKDPRVDYVQADQRITTQGTQSPTPSWGLDRTDQRDLPLNSTYTYGTTGAGVTAYVIDTGINAAHQDFGGRVSGGFTSIADGNGTNDANGHGTHVAGTVGGSSFGIAKGVSLVPVRVLDAEGSGTTSGVIAGVDWVTENHSGPSVANMSLGGLKDQALDDAVARSIASGVTYAVAAGNSSADACLSSPAAVPSALTVASSTRTDRLSSFSNTGSCVDLAAPGSDITSAWIGSTTATNTISGTSMASPHVAGAAARFLQANPSATPAQVSSGINGAATTGKVTGGLLGTSTYKLLFAAPTS
ncbi:S8 family peptidase [Solicola sp. PLA-1-18]|uniref:S8 family peptidase n=1 Tax=Solicola sp. PLA-1-18 TaxID=3380532 RepID=UPI003B7F0B4B